MPSNTQYAQLWMYNNTTDREQLFMDFRDNLAGVKVDSNMQKIDRLLSDSNDRLTVLEKIPHTVTIKATAGTSDNNFVANNVTGFSSYIVNMLLLIYLPKNNVGLTTININGTGNVSLMKIGEDGAVVNLDANDLRQNVGYLFQYNGAQLVVLGEKFEAVVTSETEPSGQFTGGIWNKLLAGGGITSYVKQTDGTYVEAPPTTKSVLVKFSNNQTLEAFKTEVLNYQTSNTSKVTALETLTKEHTTKITSLETLTAKHTTDIATNTSNISKNTQSINTKATTTTFNGTFTASGWTAISGGGYQQRVDMAVLATDTAVPWGIVPAGTVLTSDEEEAYSKVTNLNTFNGYVMGYCREEKPAINFNFIVRVVR